ncbi:hypothetical protein GCM10018773_60800 [Streptomyces candidus]|nr:hypothetical protein GCM10018773_60800 [Streptomyces candidus]
MLPDETYVPPVATTRVVAPFLDADNLTPWNGSTADKRTEQYAICGEQGPSVSPIYDMSNREEPQGSNNDDQPKRFSSTE